MSQSRLRGREWRFSSRVMLPIAAVGTTAILSLAGLLFLAASEADGIAQERQTRLVSHLLEERFAEVTYNQQSVTIWDDAIRNTQSPLDPEWFDLNLGAWLYDYFGHDRAFVLDEADRPIFAMSRGAATNLSRYDYTQDMLQPLIDDLREEMRTRPDAVIGDPQSLYTADIVVIDGRPALASVVPILSDTGRVVQAPGTERLHVSIRFLDGTLLDALARDYLIDGTRFSWTGATNPDEAAVPLSYEGGAPVGHFVWTPEQPGTRLLARTAPTLIGALVLVAALIVLLLRQLRRASTELQASEAQAQHLAFHDSLTGLANRTLFDDRLQHALVEARQHGSRLALLYLDLDRVKNVNDTLGHPAGDDLIRELASRLTALVRETDCVARLGGDVFAVLQSSVTGMGDVSALCERIIRAVAEPFTLLGSSAFVGVSIGVAVAPEAGLDRAELMRKADIALYRAKLEGRNRFRLFSEDTDGCKVVPTNGGGRDGYFNDHRDLPSLRPA